MAPRPCPRQNLTCFSAAVQHLETYWAILEKVKGSTLRLTKIDDEIYDHLSKDFPEFDPAETIDEDKLKSPAAKKRWRDFMMAYEKKVDDYSFGTMLRTSPKEEYTQHGTIFGKLAGHCSSSSSRSLSRGFQWLAEPSSQLHGSLVVLRPGQLSLGGQEATFPWLYKSLRMSGYLIGPVEQMSKR